MPPTFWFKLTGELALCACGVANPGKNEWEAYLDAVRQAVIGGTRPKAAIVCSDGGGPDAEQRKALVAAYGPRVLDVRTALCTSSMIARGITVAIAWLSQTQIKSFAYDRLDLAYEWTAVASPSFAEVEREMREAQQTLGFRVLAPHAA